MSLNRLAVRTAFVTACNNFGATPYPTLAGPHIFDSKIEPVDSVKPDIAYPMGVIYTDYDKDGLAHQELIQGDRLMTVTIELLIGIVKKQEEVEGYTVHFPVTDSELEASLDIFEAQIWEALRADNSAANTFRTICYGVEQVISRRGASTEGGTKVAARQITLECRTLHEPSRPVLTPYMDSFLADLEASDGFGLVGAELRAIYEGNAATTMQERIRRTMGWSDQTYGFLGYPTTPLSLLPEEVVWLNPDGTPIG
jgi:hypothetical protein